MKLYLHILSTTLFSLCFGSQLFGMEESKLITMTLETFTQELLKTGYFKNNRRRKNKYRKHKKKRIKKEIRCTRINCPQHSNKRIIPFDGTIFLKYNPNGEAYGGREYFFTTNKDNETIDATVTEVQYIMEREPSCTDFKRFSEVKSRSTKGLRPIDGIEAKIGNRKHRMTFPELYRTKAGTIFTPNLTKNTAYKVIGLKIFYRSLDKLIDGSLDPKKSDFLNKNDINKMIEKALELKKLHPEATQKLQELLSKPLESDSLLDSVD